MRVTFRTHYLGPFNKTWVVEVFDFEPGKGFKYRQIQGPFANGSTRSGFIPDGERNSFLENEIGIPCASWHSGKDILRPNGAPPLEGDVSRTAMP